MCDGALVQGMLHRDNRLVGRVDALRHIRQLHCSQRWRWWGNACEVLHARRQPEQSAEEWEGGGGGLSGVGRDHERRDEAGAPGDQPIGHRTHTAHQTRQLEQTRRTRRPVRLLQLPM